MRTDNSGQDERFLHVDLPQKRQSKTLVRPEGKQSHGGASANGGTRRPLLRAADEGGGRKADVAAMVQLELDFERAVAGCRQIAAFRRNAATWELFLLLALNHGKSGMGIHETVDQIQCSALGQSALLKFIQQQRDVGTILVTPSAGKRSKASLSLSAPIMQRLEMLFAQRTRLQIAATARI